ncbi:hypothetical protein MES5069_520028 [Mesorhizobium escarrei]|uniref:Uncharacterized protein n=1 Tax=Mesorhizobium escarrei TaxID=666018 RepID=A0ABN8K7H7_9HYPH|nr:hypothetical protein MES5069_520028 [Mesorhizobium escarrei]
MMGRLELAFDVALMLQQIRENGLLKY